MQYWDSDAKGKLISAMNLKGAKHSATKKKRERFLYSLRLDMDSKLLGNNYSKIVLLFNDEQEHKRWNDTFDAILSESRLFSRGLFGAGSGSDIDAVPSPSSPGAAQQPDPRDTKAWQEWQQEHTHTAKVSGGGGSGGASPVGGGAGGHFGIDRRVGAACPSSSWKVPVAVASLSASTMFFPARVSCQ